MWGFLFSLLPKAIPLIRTCGGVVVSGCVGFVMGWYVTDSHYQEKEKERELAVAQAMAKQKEEYNAKLLQAYNELDAVKRDAGELRASLDRVRSAYRARQTAPGAQRIDQGRIGECERLLIEGAGLVGEGSDLLFDQHGKLKALKGLVPAQ